MNRSRWFEPALTAAVVVALALAVLVVAWLLFGLDLGDDDG